jgi:hypothetical protein
MQQSENGNGARITIRLSHRLRDAVKRIARHDRRSLNSWLVVLLEQQVKQREGDHDA